jgi:hypothetical protein
MTIEHIQLHVASEICWNKVQNIEALPTTSKDNFEEKLGTEFIINFEVRGPYVEPWWVQLIVAI